MREQVIMVKYNMPAFPRVSDKHRLASPLFELLLKKPGPGPTVSLIHAFGCAPAHAKDAHLDVIKATAGTPDTQIVHREFNGPFIPGKSALGKYTR